MSETPAFKSALDYCLVRDFAYPNFHPLHYGTNDFLNEPVTTTNDAQPFISPQDEPDELEEPNSDYVNANPNDIYRKAVALFDFVPENDNEISLHEGQVAWISYRHGQGWIVAHNLESGETGLVPEEYVQLLPPEEGDWVDEKTDIEAASPPRHPDTNSHTATATATATQTEPEPESTAHSTQAQNHNLQTTPETATLDLQDSYEEKQASLISPAMENLRL